MKKLFSHGWRALLLLLAAALCYGAAFSHILPAAGWNAMLERNFEPSSYGRNGPYLSGEPLTYQKVSRCFPGKSGFTEERLGEAPGRMRFYESANTPVPAEVFEAGETVVVEGSPAMIESYGMNTYPGERANRRFAVPYARSMTEYQELLRRQREGTLEGCFVPVADLLHSYRDAMRQSAHRFPVGEVWGGQRQSGPAAPPVPLDRRRALPQGLLHLPQPL